MNLRIKLKKKIREFLHKLVEWLEDLEDYREIKRVIRGGELEEASDFEEFVKTLRYDK